MCVCAVIVQAFKSNVHVNVGLYIRSCTSVLTAAKLHSSTLDPSIHTSVDGRQTVLEHSALSLFVCVYDCQYPILTHTYIHTHSHTHTQYTCIALLHIPILLYPSHST